MKAQPSIVTAHITRARAYFGQTVGGISKTSAV